MKRSRIVVIGGGAGSAAAVAELRKQGFDGSLTLVSAENTVPYERPPLSKGFLLGTSGQVPVKDAAWYEQASVEPHEPDRDRKLLLHRRQIDQLAAKTAEKGLTLVPTRLYFKDGRAKVELAVARGKEGRDKRRDIADRESKRRIERELKSRRR